VELDIGAGEYSVVPSDETNPIALGVTPVMGEVW